MELLSRNKMNDFWTFFTRPFFIFTILWIMLQTHIVNAVDKRIIAGIWHRQPITAKPYDVDVAILVDFWPSHLKDVVELQRKPGDAERHDDNHQHFNNFLLVLEKINVAHVLRIARRFAAPQLNGHLWVEDRQSNCSNYVNKFPVHTWM